MARLRKAARIWRNPSNRAAALGILVSEETALFTLDPAQLFRHPAALEVELGAGRGDFLIERAAANRDRNFLAIELAASVARLMAARAGRRGITNLRVACADARTAVNLLLPDRCVAVYHVYFPDPWPKMRHQKHRLLTPRLVASMARTLSSGGIINIASDVESWAQEMFAMFLAGGFAELDHDVSGAQISGFGRKYAAAGRPIYSAAFALRKPPFGHAPT